jgi:hypothetical protein
MLHVLLRDRRSGQHILAATTHLKAKGGQVSLHIFNFCSACTTIAGLPQLVASHACGRRSCYGAAAWPGE